MLLRKMWRDLLQNKVQFFSIFLMSLLGIYVFVGIDSECNGMKTYEARFYESTKLPDLFLTGIPFTKDDVKKIRKIPGVLSAERRSRFDGKAELSEEYDLQLNFLEEETLSKMLLLSGEEYVPGKNGIWLDYNFAEKQGLKKGDSLRIKVDGKSFTEIVRGTFYHPEYVYFLPDAAAMMPDYGNYGAAFLDAGEYPDQENFYYNQMILDLKGVDNTGGLSEEEKTLCKTAGDRIIKELDSKVLVAMDKDEQLSYQTFHAEIEQHDSISLFFPAVFVMISILGIITTMTRMTSRQRIQIGTLKALGFTKKTIILHFASYGFFLSLLGGILGAVLGYHTIAKLILEMEATTYLVPGMKIVFSPKSYAAILVQVVISSIVSFLACRKELLPPPADTLRPASPKVMKQTFLERSSLWMRLDFATQWNLRDILRNKVRTLMGIIGVAGCAMLIFAALSCLDTVAFITTWMYGELNTSRIQIVMKAGSPLSLTSEYAAKYKGQMIETAPAEFEKNGVKKTGSVTAYDNGNYLHFQDPDLQGMKLNKDGVSISYKMAQLLNVKEGEIVRWHLVGDDHWKLSRISGIYRHPVNQGITMTREIYEQYELDFIPDRIMTNVDPKEALSDDKHVVGVQSLDEMMKAFDSMKEMMYTMVYIMVAAAIVLGVVVLYNLGVLSMVEKHREMATLKVLGFRTAKIRSILQKQNMVVTSAGILAGIPAGVWLIVVLFATMPESMDYVATFKLPSVLYTIIGTMSLSMVVNRLLSKKVKTVDMVDALKGQE